MIDRSKLTVNRLTEEDLSLLTLSAATLKFSTIRQFENWFFILNFPLLKRYVRKSNLVKTSETQCFEFDWPFDIIIGEAYQTGNDTFIYHHSNKEDVGYVLRCVG